MSTVAAIQLHPAAGIELGRLVPMLEGRLNRVDEPAVSVTEVDGEVCFRAETWLPILRVRVEDALDELIGSAWSCGFTWT